MRKDSPIWAVTVLIAAACADQSANPVLPTQPPLEEQALVNAVPNMAVDDTDELQRALDSGGTVLLRGEYHISRPLRLRSNTSVYGDGSATIYQQSTGSHVFIAEDPSGGNVSDIIVDSLQFVAAEPPAAGTVSGTPRPYALFVKAARNVKFRNNRVTNMGIFEADHTLPYSASSMPLSSNLEITDNIGVGRSTLYPSIEGIVVGYATDVVVARNNVSHYWTGIQWWGGNALTGDGVPGNPRWAKRITIMGNWVTETESGIWGSMGEDITVTKWNHVEVCYDVCLDAEGSNNVIFEESDALYARNMVLGVFGHSNGVTFRWINAVQDDRIWPDGHQSNALFATSSWYDATRISVHNVAFAYRGAGVGTVTKAESTYFLFANNTLENTIIDVDGNHAGGVRILGNEIRLDRSAGAPAIKVGHNYGFGGQLAPPVNGPWQAEIVANTITSTVSQSGPGILVTESNPYPSGPINHSINNNTIRAYPTSVRIATVNANDSRFQFTVENNKYTGLLDPARTTGYITVRNNTKIN